MKISDRLINTGEQLGGLKLFKKFCFGASLLLLAACLETRGVSVSPANASSSAFQVAKSYMAERLKDPESMKVRRVKHYKTAEGDRIVCGEMDAKNSYGGYNGYSTFYFRLLGGTVKVAHFGKSSEYSAARGCAEAQAGEIQVAVEG